MYELAGNSETSQHSTSQDQTLLNLRSQIQQFDTFNNVDKLRIWKKSKDGELFSFPDIMAATNSFSLANKLGEGGFGPVYKVKLQIVIKLILFS